jgi:hypothetical protein
MPLEPGISEFIANRIQDGSAEAARLLTEHVNRHPDHAGRVSRCIAFLAKGSLSEWQRMIKTAHEDFRDEIFWAEDRDWSATSPQRIRNFIRPFGQEDEPAR